MPRKRQSSTLSREEKLERKRQDERKRRAMRRVDPQLRADDKVKEREKYLERKMQGKVKLTADLTPEELIGRRKRILENVRRHRLRLRQSRDGSQQPIPPATPNPEQPAISGYSQSDNKPKVSSCSPSLTIERVENDRSSTHRRMAKPDVKMVRLENEKDRCRMVPSRKKTDETQNALMPVTIKVESLEEYYSSAGESQSSHTEDTRELAFPQPNTIKIEPPCLHEASTSNFKTSLELNTQLTATSVHSQISDGEEDPLSTTKPKPKNVKQLTSEDSSVPSEKNSERDPIDDFFQAMATSVKKFSPLLQLQVKQKVSQAVFEAESVMLSMN